MEKIYENKNQQKKKYKTFQSMRLDSVSCLLFAIALILTSGFVVAGLSNSSYAAPDADLSNITAIESSKDYIMGNNAESSMDTLSMRTATAGTENIYVYCIERYREYAAGEYSKDGSIDDLGLNYLLNAFDINNGNFNLDGVTNHTGGAGDTIADVDIKYWAGQAAIYSYLYGDEYNIAGSGEVPSTYLKEYKTFTTNPDASDVGVGYLDDKTVEDLAGSNYVRANDGKTLFNAITVGGKTINEAISYAKSLNSTGNLFSLSISNTKEGLSKSGNYFVSGPYKAILKHNIDYTNSPSVEIKVRNAPSGTKIVGSDGKELTNPLSGTVTQFSIMIPQNKVKEAKKITVLGSSYVEFNGPTKYVADGKQSLAILQPNSKSISTGIDFEIAPTSDTGVNIGQTIYFIGLIILLCGVGIIYANAKTTQTQE